MPGVPGAEFIVVRVAVGPRGLETRDLTDSSEQDTLPDQTDPVAVAKKTGPSGPLKS